MRRAGFLDDAALARARAAPLGLRRPRRDYGHVAPWYTERARRLLEQALPDDVARGGLVVDTAALPALAADAQAALRARTDALDPSQSARGRRPGLGPPHRLRRGPGRRADLVDQPVRPGRPGLPPAGLVVEADPLRRRARGRRHHRGHAAARRAGHRVGPVARRVLEAARRPRVPRRRAGRRRPGPVAQRAGHQRPRSGRRRPRDRAGPPARHHDPEVADARPMALGASCVKPMELARAYARSPAAAGRCRRTSWSACAATATILFDATVPEDATLAPARPARSPGLGGRPRSRRAGVRRGRPPGRSPTPRS